MLLPYSRYRGCSHDSTVEVISNGLERVVCEDCGLVTVRFGEMISGSVDRSKFRRKADYVGSGRHIGA